VNSTNGRHRRRHRRLLLRRPKVDLYLYLEFLLQFQVCLYLSVKKLVDYLNLYHHRHHLMELKVLLKVQER
jgi:hypothetical protein